MQNKQQSPSGYRHIVPATSAQAFVPMSPYHLPQAALPPFETPPASPFSQPMHNYNGQSVFKLPPPMQPLSPATLHGCQPILSSSPTPNLIHQQNVPRPTNISLDASPVHRPIMQHHTSVIHTLTSPHLSPDKPLTTADQRELARKVSHSAIERRRRERINDKIMQLKELIPSCADQDHLNKLCILQSSIEYIEYLQDLVFTYRQREKDGGKTDDNRSSEDGRVVKRSKFDRYDILPSSKLSSKRFESLDDNKEYRHKSPASSSTSPTSSGQALDFTEKVNSDDNDSTIKTAVSDISPISPDSEEAGTLLLLSNSSSTTQKSKTIVKPTSTVQESEKIITTRNSETQTSPIYDWEEPFEESENVQETQASLSHKWNPSKESETVREPEESPRRGISVQQLLC
ncbi:HLH-domain-containing protein [Gigaspora margarita]|uniref:HLH-domain-containing protein n=1 Tax=Gigaspora margarita TaxID=4874 RepID=A0A8H4AEZ3_GIGMA|nr:HLH-domain-containing protein [Gigaspora margarita]